VNNRKILLVDDDDLALKFFSRVLSDEGYSVLTASGGEEALDLLSRVPVDLIILDMHMPVMSGLEFLQHLEGRRGASVPVLMISGDDDPDMRTRSYALGVYDFIGKTEPLEIMLKRIDNGITIGAMVTFAREMKNELFMAKKLQHYLFPPGDFTGPRWDLQCWTRPLTDIGGDLYDYVHYQNGDLYFFIADVSGHGISASLYTAIVKMLFRSALKQATAPHEIVTIINRELTQSIPVESFVTMICGYIDHRDNLLHYVNAGHPAPLLVGADGPAELPGNSPFLGAIADAVFETTTVMLLPGTACLFYTDGLTDLMGADGTRLAMTLIEDVFSRQELPPAGRRDIFLQRLDSPEIRFTDDSTFLYLTVK
jgi:phosphoserine phosphatase RsbU/P